MASVPVPVIGNIYTSKQCTRADSVFHSFLNRNLSSSAYHVPDAEGMIHRSCGTQQRTSYNQIILLVNME